MNYNRNALFRLKRIIINSWLSIAEIFKKRPIGEESYLGFNVQVLGWDNIRIGSNTIVGDNSWLNVNHRRAGSIGIEIGNNCYIAKNNVISSAKKVIVHDFFMSNVNVNLLGSNHIFNDPMKPYIQTGATAEGILYIGVNVWIGANSCVLGDVRIGHGSIIGAGSVVTKSIPPFSIAVGNPAKVIKRYSFDRKKWLRVEEYRDQEELFPSEEEYLETLSKDVRRLPVVIAGKYAGDI